MPFFIFFQAEDGIRVLLPALGIGDVYKSLGVDHVLDAVVRDVARLAGHVLGRGDALLLGLCPSYTSDAADDLMRVNLRVVCSFTTQHSSHQFSQDHIHSRVVNRYDMTNEL